MTAQLSRQQGEWRPVTKWHHLSSPAVHIHRATFLKPSDPISFDIETSFEYEQDPTANRRSSLAVVRKLSLTASGIMRLLRQISLDGTFSKSAPDQVGRLGQNFARHFSDTINLAIGLLDELKSGETAAETASKIERSGKKQDKSSSVVDILKVLEELNSLIVHLIKLSSDTQQKCNETQEKPEKPEKSKLLRRQFSAFVESDKFRRIRRSLSRQDSEGSLNTGSLNGSPSSSPPKTGNLSSPLLLEEAQFVSNLGCSLEEAIRKLIDSKLLNYLISHIYRFGFEEKKIIRMILSNSIILKVNNRHPVVEYISDTSSNDILNGLVKSYELGRSDVTLNCGFILRFASQYQLIVSAILQSDLLYNFVAYMQRCPSNYPFDVAMDVFYTFKTILTRHRPTTIAILQSNPVPFFDALIQLLRHADETENYVTKRQTLEIFADIFSSGECNQLREQFITQNCYVCLVIVYLWNPNLQIRLRCLVLLNQLFRVSKDVESVSVACDNGDTQSENDNKKSGNARSNCKEVESVVREDDWMIQLLLDKIKISVTDNKEMAELSEQPWILNMFVELRDECCKSSIKQFTSQLPFIDQVINSINSS